MRFADWEPHYTAILEYFGFEREADEAAARLLADLAFGRDDVGLLEALIRDKTVTVCGNAPSLPEELDRVEGTVLAADAAAEVLVDHGVRPDAVFTDLDGATDVFVDLSRQGTVMVVHAHGDNIPLLRHWVPLLPGPLVATTQAAPLSHVHNFGGRSLPPMNSVRRGSGSSGSTSPTGTSTPSSGANSSGRESFST